MDTSNFLVFIASVLLNIQTILAAAGTYLGCAGMQYIAYPNHNLVFGDGVIRGTLNSITETGCRSECFLNQNAPTNCKSINFNFNTDTCYLLNEDQSTNTFAESYDFNYWELCAGCNSKPTYITTPVNYNAVCSSNSKSWSVTMSCHTGYLWNDGSKSTVKTATCLCSTETWEAMTDSCDIVQCPSVPIVTNANSVDTGTTHKSKVTYTCFSGYEKVSGDSEILCGSDAIWVGTLPVCQFITTIPPSTTVSETTLAPTTEAETTIAPTTESVTTLAPTTESVTTLAATTESVTTLAATTESVTTVAPTTESVTTLAPTTESVTTSAPTTESVTTLAPTTESVTTSAPTTESVTTLAPTTEAVTTLAPTTESVTTLALTTESVTTLAPTTESVTTLAPTTESVTTLAPTTELETTLAPTTELETSLAPTTELETTLIPSTQPPSTFAPRTTLAHTTESETTSAYTTETESTKGHTPTTPAKEEQTTQPVILTSLVPEITTAKLSCQVPPTPVHASMTYTDSCNTTVRVKCIVGYLLRDGSAKHQVTCSSNGTWHLADFVCERYICPSPPTLSHRTLVYESRHEGGQSVYTCTEGRVFVDNSVYMNLTCTQMVWTGDIKQCREVVCSPFQVAHGTINFLQGPVYKQAIVHCDTGYRFDDGSRFRTVTCVADNVWHIHPKHITCKAYTCASINQSNTTVIYNSTTIQVGTYYDGYCDTGTVFSDGSDYMRGLCTSTGKWSHVVTPCQEPKCPVAPYLPRSTVKKLGSFFVYYCLQGYRFEDGVSVKILGCHGAMDKIGRTPYVCLDITCPEAPSVRNAHYNTTLATFGTVIKYQCHRGYWFPDHMFIKTTQCQGDGTWTTTLIPNCTETYCTDLSPLDSTHLSSHLRTVDAMVTLTCSPASLRFVDGKQSKSLTCLPSGLWNDVVSNCSDDRCAQVPSVLNAFPDTKFAVYGTVVHYKCLPGYEFESGLTEAGLECSRPMQAWNGSLTHCQPISCPDIVPLNYILDTNSTAYPNTVTMTCYPGYSFNNDMVETTVTCQNNKTWIYNDPSVDMTLGCQTITCTELTTLQHLQVNTTATIYNTSVIVTCTEGYWFHRNLTQKTVTCDSTGNWTDVITDCNEIHCPSIPMWLNINADNTGTRTGVKVKYKCTEGYHFGSNVKTTPQLYKIAKCSSSGLWEPGFQQCLRIVNVTYVEQPTEAPMSKNIGILAGIVFSLTFAALVILDIPALLRDLTTMVHNIKCCQTLAINAINKKHSYIPCEELARRKSTWL